MNMKFKKTLLILTIISLLTLGLSSVTLAVEGGWPADPIPWSINEVE
jgi:hypothetical protein